MLRSLVGSEMCIRDRSLRFGRSTCSTVKCRLRGSMLQYAVNIASRLGWTRSVHSGAGRKRSALPPRFGPITSGAKCLQAECYAGGHSPKIEPQWVLASYLAALRVCLCLQFGGMFIVAMVPTISPPSMTLALRSESFGQTSAGRASFEHLAVHGKKARRATSREQTAR